MATYLLICQKSSTTYFLAQKVEHLDTNVCRLQQFVINISGTGRWNRVNKHTLQRTRNIGNICRAAMNGCQSTTKEIEISLKRLVINISCSVAMNNEGVLIVLVSADTDQLCEPVSTVGSEH